MINNNKILGVENIIDKFGTVYDTNERIIRKGSGSFGTVFCIKNKVDNKMNAVKVAKCIDDTCNDLLREYDLMMRLKNDHIVSSSAQPFISINEEDGTKKIYINNSICANGTLEDYMNHYDERKKIIRTTHDLLIPSVAFKIIKHISLGINHMHEKGYVHRDIKPTNVLIVEEQHKIVNSLVSDFGFSAPKNSAYVFDKSSTELYRAPEHANLHVIRNDPNYDPRKLDIYSLGLLFINILTNIDMKTFNNLGLKFYEIGETANEMYYRNENYNAYNKLILSLIPNIYRKTFGHLIISMLNPNYNERINMNYVMNKLEHIEKEIPSLDSIFIPSMFNNSNYNVWNPIESTYTSFQLLIHNINQMKDRKINPTPFLIKKISDIELRDSLEYNEYKRKYLKYKNKYMKYKKI